MISRRHFIVSSATLATLTSMPLAARPPSVSLLVVDPSILAVPPPADAVTLTGHALLQAILPQIDALPALEGIVREADAQLLAELVRFHPRLRWQSSPLAPGAMSAFGPVRRSALLVRAALARGAATQDKIMNEAIADLHR